AAALVIVARGAAQADLSQKVPKEFRGQLIITKGGLAVEGVDDAESISAIKKARLKEVAHISESDGVAEWSFDYVAFLNKAPKVTKLSVDFYTADKSEKYVANKGLMGIDPELPILSGTLSITEDDGPTRGQTYRVKITGKVKGKDVVFAETTVLLK